MCLQCWNSEFKEDVNLTSSILPEYPEYKYIGS